jgi:hypothetical protein
VTGAPGCTSGATSATVVDRYETLRRGALGAPLEPAARSGLGILLTRGMWSWAQATVAEADPPSPRAVHLGHVGPGGSPRLAGLLAELTIAVSGRCL